MGVKNSRDEFKTCGKLAYLTKVISSKTQSNVVFEGSHVFVKVQIHEMIVEEEPIWRNIVSVSSFLA